MNRPVAFDSGLILYSSFNSSRPTENVVGCRIASGASSNAYFRTSNGLVLSGNLTEFSIDLTPGTYDLVFTPKAYQEESDWFNGSQTNRVEIWGLPNSLSFSDELANTGSQPWLLFAGIALLSAGLSIRRLAK